MNAEQKYIISFDPDTLTIRDLVFLDRASRGDISIAELVEWLALHVSVSDGDHRKIAIEDLPAAMLTTIVDRVAASMRVEDEGN